MTATLPLSERDRDTLRACDPIAALEAGAREQLLEAFVVEESAAGTVLLVEGSVGETFHVLLSGTVAVEQHHGGATVHLTDLHQGDYFGEQALLTHDGRRAATVRTTTECRIATLQADVFRSVIARVARNRERFEQDALIYLHRQITQAFDPLIEEGGDGVERLTFDAGTAIVREGDASDAAYLVITGEAVVSRRSGSGSRDVARLGAGQIFGELGVLHGEPRAATVMAVTPLQVLRIDASSFIRWHQAHPVAAGLFQSFARIYSLTQDRRMSVFLGEFNGAQTWTTVVGRPEDGVVSTRVVGRNAVVFTNAAAKTREGDRDEIRYADDVMTRELRVIVTERRDRIIQRCIVYAVRADGIDNDLGTLYQHVLALDEVDAVALRRFERTGFLGGQAARSDRLCACLGLGAQELRAAAEELGTDYHRLQENMGVGSICGGCDRPVRAFLEQLQTQAVTPPDAPLDASPEKLTPDERQLAALLARGMGFADAAVTQEQVAVRLRATGVRDMAFFIDLLFPNVFTTHGRATYRALAAAVGRGSGFGPWRSKALQPRTWLQRLQRAASLGVYHLGRRGLLALLGVAVVGSVAAAPQVAGIAWFSLALIALGVHRLLPDTPTVRFFRTFVWAGPARYYRGLWSAVGDERRVGVLALSPGGPPTYYPRDETLVDHVLQRPDIYARQALWEYPPFGAHSMLGGGSSGVWLGYRMLFEEYFAETYRGDLEEMRAIVRERLAMWEGRESFLLLEELYRIVLELRGRVFFQSSFDCFDDEKSAAFVQAVDRILGPEVQLMNGMAGGAVRLVRERITAAMQKATRPDSIGGIISEALRSGDINEHEARENAAMYVLAQAPTMAMFWTLYRTARTGRQQALRGNRRELTKALKEELRLHPGVTSMFQREVLQDDTLGDHVLCPGSRVNLSPMYVHTNPAQWTDPLAFDPDRWEIHTGDARELVEPRTDPSDAASRPASQPACPHALRYLPFGGGGQACQGRWFAADEMLLVLEEILARYDFEVIEDQGLLDRPLQDQVLLHIYNRPANDVRVRPIPVG